MYYNNYEIEMMHKAKSEDQLREAFINNTIKENRMLNTRNTTKISPQCFNFIKSFSFANLFSNIKHNRMKIKLAKK